MTALNNFMRAPRLFSDIETQLKKFDQLTDVFETKEKYNTDLIKCIETEISPGIESKIIAKVKL